MFYNSTIKKHARTLRQSMTDSETILWSRLRRKQILNTKFLRQKPYNYFILDFYAPKIKLAIELDGSQHYTELGLIKDIDRDNTLSQAGVHVLRYPNHEVIHRLNVVLDDIYFHVQRRIQR